MAMVPTYQRQVQINEAPGYRVQPAAGPETFGAGFGQSLSNAGSALNEMAVKQQAKLNQIAVANAMSNMQQSLTPIQTDLLMRKGQNALGTAATEDKPATPSVTQEWQQRSSELFDKTMKSFTNENQRQQFSMWWNSVHPGMDDAVYKHEKTQLDAAHTAAGEAQLSASSDSFVSNALIGASIGNFTMANNDLLSGMKMSSDMGIVNGLPDAVLKENSNKFIFGSINKAVDIAISNNRAEDAKKIIDNYSDKLDEGQKQILSAKVQPQIEKSEVDSYVNSLKSRPDMLNPDGTLNTAKMLQEADSYYRNKTRSVTKPGTMQNYSWDQTKELVSKNESKGDYNAPNPDSGAYGKYQFMPGTWQGLMGNAPMTPENQEAAFEKKYKPIYDKYGTAGVLVAVYAGDDNAGRYMRGEQLIGENGPYSADAPQGKYPSVRQYVINALGNDGMGTPATTEQVASPDLVGLQLAKQMIGQAGAESQAQHKQSIENAMYGFDNYLIQNHPTTVAEIEQAAKQFGFQGPDLMSAISKGMGYAGLLRSEDNRIKADIEDQIYKDIYTGEITSPAQLDVKYAGKIPYRDLISFENSLKKETKWATPENIDAFRGILSENKVSDPTEKGIIRERINQKAAENAAKGLPVTTWDIITWTNEQSKEIIINRNALGFGGTKVREGVIPSSWKQTQYGVLDENGIEQQWDEGQHRWRPRNQ